MSNLKEKSQENYESEPTDKRSKSIDPRINRKKANSRIDTNLKEQKLKRIKPAHKRNSSIKKDPKKSEFETHLENASKASISVILCLFII